MIVFYVLILIPLLVQHMKVLGIGFKKRNKFAMAFFFLFLTVLVMLRHESVGSDTRNYIYYFDRISEMSMEEINSYPLEVGYCYLNKAVSLLSQEPQIFLAVVAMITSLLIYPTYRRLCVDSSLTIVLFCIMSTFLMMFSGIRQMLAIAIGFRAYEFTRQRRLIPFLISVFVAIAFHTSAVMLLPMYVLFHCRITKKWLYVLAPVLAAVFVLNEQIFTLLASLLEHYTKYDATIENTGAYEMLILFAVFVVFSYLIPNEKQLDTETVGLRNFLLLAVAVQMFAPLHTLAMRMNYYYIIFIPLLIPKIIACRCQRWAKIAVFARYTMVLLFMVYFFVTANDGLLHVFPYHFFWEIA